MPIKFPLLLALLLPLSLRAAAIPAEQVEFFEKKIRPILAQECYECHSTSSGKKKGGLLLDSRGGWQAGGDSGETIVPGAPERSLLIRSIKHLEPDLKMPSKAPKLEEAAIRNFEEWVKMGAPDPRDQPATAEQIAQDKDWSAVFRRRSGWWSFQPVANPPVPLAGAGWSENPIDRFLADSMEKAGLKPAGDADPHMILRRLNYVLTGLAPRPDEIEEFNAAAAKDLPGAIAAAADRLLARPQFGEAWARHWMDWVRFAETHGSEGDPAIPFAWRYRDYLIRALNDDVPYPQLLREHIAGDLLEKPRINEKLGINESALGAAHYRMVLHGFTPTDAYDELCTFTDNQIDTVTKAFQGLTVACARCHNHKFDAISQADYYALFGIFASTRPATVDVGLHNDAATLSKLEAGKKELRAKLADAWLASLESLPERLEAWSPPEQEKQVDAKGKEKKLPPDDFGPLADWFTLKNLPVEKWPGTWAKLQQRAREMAAQRAQFLAQPAAVAWDLRGPDFAQWESSGDGVRQGPTAAGEFAIEPAGEQIVAGIYGAGTYSNLISYQQRALLASPPFNCDGGKLWVRVRGGSDARLRYVVRNYPRSGTVYRVFDLGTAADQWLSWDLAYWKGETLHIEISTDQDQPVEMKKRESSWFGIAEVRYLPGADSSAPPPTTVTLAALCAPDATAPHDQAELARLFATLLRPAIEHWRDGQASDGEAELLNQFARQNLLPNKLGALPAVATLVERYRKTESLLTPPTRAPGLLEGFAHDWPLMTRGDHKKEAEPVPRRFLEAIDSRPYNAGEHESGRRQLAESLVAPTNPLTSRVIVNRLWLNVFGPGLVPTPDNFGRLGEAPTHPELLDYLASSFSAQGGSIKQLLRTLVTTRAFRLDHRPSPTASERDPQNRLLSHFPSRRLEAEAIRDSIIALTGKLDTNIGGESVGSGNTRRSIYVKVVRNNLDPLLSAFDFPVPAATRGKRDSTNVPAQALALLNDKLVTTWADEWAHRIFRSPDLVQNNERIAHMFRSAFGRDPTSEETDQALNYLQTFTCPPDELQKLRRISNLAEAKWTVARPDLRIHEHDFSPATGSGDVVQVGNAAAADELKKASEEARLAVVAAEEAQWRALAQALINAKEFIYLP